MTDKGITDIDFIGQKIDWEGWPDALEWLVSDDFGDEELNQLIYDATQLHNQLSWFENQIFARVQAVKELRGITEEDDE